MNATLKSYDSRPNVSTFLSRDVIRGDLSLLLDSFFTLTNQRLFPININLLVVYRESVNLIGYITVDYLVNKPLPVAGISADNVRG